MITKKREKNSEQKNEKIKIIRNHTHKQNE